VYLFSYLILYQRSMYIFPIFDFPIMTDVYVFLHLLFC